jgi:undecaprenyl-diphosphatase
VPILWLVIILGIVEGVTEYLPVSSTGHLILATELLGYDADKWALFNIAIQPGAILAILVLYWRTFRDVLVGMFQREPSAWKFVRNLLVAFVPAVVIGLAIGDSIELLLGNAHVVAVSLILGGFAILLVEWWAKPTDRGGVANVTFGHSVGIGLVQCLAMIPGVSRSGATILGAMAMGVDRKTAAEFSFFLAVPTLSGATALQLYKHGAAMEPGMGGWIVLGSIVSFVVAVIVVKAFVSIIQRYGFAPFAWYRIAAGAVALVWLAMR